METSYARSDLLWLATSLSYIDFTMEVFIVECMTISFWSKGGFSYSVIKELDFYEYELVLKEAMRIQALHKSGSAPMEGQDE